MDLFWPNYGLFLAKTLTFVLAILFLLAGILAISLRQRNKEGELELYSLSEKLLDLKNELQLQTLSKSERKAFVKAEKQHRKSLAHLIPRLFVIHFQGDIKASQTTGLKEIVNALLLIAKPDDEILVTIESAGGFVHSYGLAALQLLRLRERGLKLTVAVDKVAASGGYLMACVAQHIIAAPFALIGSIGVIAQLPNFNRLLKKHDIDLELHTAGKFKRTLTMFGENTEDARHKFLEELNTTHDLFKKFVREYRPNLVLDDVATGEHWYGTEALEKGLIDRILASDSYLLEQLEQRQIFELSYKVPKKLLERLLGSSMHNAFLQVFDRYFPIH